MGYNDYILKCVISGSFDKFKDVIDKTIDEFVALGVNVLAPEKGWLYIPNQRAVQKGFRPLPNEIGMTIKQIEESFLTHLANSDFLYVVNPDGYIGNTVSMEIGFAYARQIPIYLQNPVSKLLDLDTRFETILNNIKVLDLENILKDIKNNYKATSPYQDQVAVMAENFQKQ